MELEVAGAGTFSCDQAPSSMELEGAGADTEEFFFLKTGDSSTDLKRSQSKLSSFQKLLPQPTSLLVLEPGGVGSSEVETQHLQPLGSVWWRIVR